MKPESIALKEAQNLILASQKLTGSHLEPIQIIEHLGYVQIDTISVIERAHHHVFWTRNPKYNPKILEDLHQSRKVFEYWSHAASYLPMNEYRFSLPMKKAFREKSKPWFPRDTKLMSAVLERIHNEGALRSKDFDNKRQGNTGWWDWKPAKKALENLFLEGSLEISRREGFQKVYDLPERVIPSAVNNTMPTDREYIRFLVNRTLRHHGLASINEIAYLRQKAIKIRIAHELNNMLEDGEVIQVKVENNQEVYFAFPQSFDSSLKHRSKLLLLSPFDNFVIQRKKLKSFFNFDYQIECYVPAPKRKYGYFCLPVFFGNKAVARIDCKADRKTQQFIINSIHYEKNVDKESLKSKLEDKLKTFAKFNKCRLDF